MSDAAKEVRRIFAGAGLGGVEDEGTALVARGREGDGDRDGGRGGHGGDGVVVLWREGAEEEGKERWEGRRMAGRMMAG